jgi:hypothetical protein
MMSEENILFSPEGILLLQSDVDMTLWNEFADPFRNRPLEQGLCLSAECDDNPRDCILMRKAIGCQTCIRMDIHCHARDAYYRWLLTKHRNWPNDRVAAFLDSYLAQRFCEGDVIDLIPPFRAKRTI